MAFAKCQLGKFVFPLARQKRINHLSNNEKKYDPPQVQKHPPEAGLVSPTQPILLSLYIYMLLLFNC